MAIGPSRFHIFRFPFPLLQPHMGADRGGDGICKLLCIETVDLRIYEPSVQKNSCTNVEWLFYRFVSEKVFDPHHTSAFSANSLAAAASDWAAITSVSFTKKKAHLEPQDNFDHCVRKKTRPSHWAPSEQEQDLPDQQRHQREKTEVT